MPPSFLKKDTRNRAPPPRFRHFSFLVMIGKILLLFTGIKRPLLSGIIKAGIKPLTLEPFALSRGLFLKKKKKILPVNHFAVGQVTVAGMYSVAKGLGSAHS